MEKYTVDYVDNFVKEQVNKDDIIYKINQKRISKDDIDMISFEKLKDQMVSKKEIVILDEKKENIKLIENDHSINYFFHPLKKNSYKIKCKLSIKNCNNIKLIIENDHKKSFTYDYLEKNYDKNKIDEYGFILDTHFDICENILISIIFDGNDILIDNISIEIIEKEFNNDNALIIFDVNNKYIPIYTNTINILDFNDYSDYNSIFFV